MLAGLAAFAAAAPGAGRAQGAVDTSTGVLLGSDFGLRSNNGAEGDDPAQYDQSERMQAAVDAAASRRTPLFLEGGYYAVGGIKLSSVTTIYGVMGGTVLLGVGARPMFSADGQSSISLRSLSLDAAGRGPTGDAGLISFRNCERVELENLDLAGGTGNGLYLERTAANVRDLTIHGFEDSGIFALDNWGLSLTGNRIFGCGNAGIRIWGNGGEHDGSVVAANRIYEIAAKAGGSGQNGNGINVFKANDVTVSDNHISNCAFTAVRVNSAKNARVDGNICLGSGEVAIFSEFAFSGSVVSNNIIDGAATGISITNLDSGGHLAVCSGNIVRNIYEGSAVNPDTRPVGIYAEAETVVSGNTIENVPGVGIVAGYGAFLRNVVVANNVIHAVKVGIGVSVVDNPSPGPVKVSGNMIGDPLDYGIVGMAWDEMVSDDLIRDAGKYPHVTLSDNTVAHFG